MSYLNFSMGADLLEANFWTAITSGTAHDRPRIICKHSRHSRLCQWFANEQRGMTRFPDTGPTAALRAPPCRFRDKNVGRVFLERGLLHVFRDNSTHGSVGSSRRTRSGLPRTLLLYIRQIVEPQPFSIFQPKHDTGTDVSPPRSQALQLPGLNRNRDRA